MRMMTVLVLLAAASLAGCATSSAPPQAAAPKPEAAKPARTAAQIQIDELIDKPEAHAVFKKVAPDLAANPQLSMARGMSLADVAGYSQAGLTPEMVQAIVDGVNEL